MELVAKEYKYAVVRFLQQPREDLGEFACVPLSWIRVRRVGDDQSIVAYPNERPSVTQRRIKDREPPSEKWVLHLVVVKLETYTYEDAECYILEKKYEVAAEDLCTHVESKNISQKRPRALEFQCKHRADRTNGDSIRNKISAENTSVTAKNKVCVYPYLQRIPDYCQDSENDNENIIKKPCHISRDFLNTMRKHLSKSRNQNEVITSNDNTEIPKDSEVHQDNPQVLHTGRVSEEPSVAEPPQLSHGSQGSVIQPMIVDEPEENEDTLEVSSQDDDSDRSDSPGRSTEETDQPVGYPTDKIRTQANFMAGIFKTMEKSEQNSSETVLELQKSLERSREFVKRFKNASISKKLELNKEKQDEVETPDVEVRNDVKSRSNDDNDEDEDDGDKDEDGKAPKKLRNLRSFVLPPDYDPNDTRWTLKYRENDPELGLEELIPGSKVFIDSIRLAHCRRVSKDCKTLARMLLTEIYSQSALAVCSLTGAKANAFHNNGTYVRPGLDKNARVTMLTYVERHSRKEKWTTYDKQSVINSIRSRVQEIRDKILELKKQIGQVDKSTHHYLNAGLIVHHLTSFDAELTDIPEKIERSEDLNIIVKESFNNAEKQIAKLALKEGDREEDKQSTDENEGYDVIEPLALWESDDEENTEDTEVKHTEPVDLRRTYVNIIWATEKTRQVIRKFNAKAIMKVKWVKELEGTANPKARPEIRAKAIILIRDSYRAYVKIKRQRIEEAKVNDVLDICKQALPNHDAKKKNEDIWSIHAKKYKEYEKDYKMKMEEFQLEYRRSKSEFIADDLRDMLRNWFQQWFNEIKYVQDIPVEKEGGSCLILNEEFLTPMQWLEKYNAFLSQKGKSSEKKKQEKEEKKREAQMKKKEEAAKKRQEELLLKKMAKNPRLHPGYRYPVSEKTELIAQTVQDYHRDWNYLDVEEDKEAKIKYCKHKMEEETFVEVFLAVLKDVDNEMREECKVLKSALKKDYESNGIEFPKMALEGGKREKKKKLKSVKSENLPDKLAFLVMHKILREYPKLKLEDYVGDPNFVGDDLRELDKETKAFCGDTREEWWDHCLALARGYSRTLLVGARGSGKRPMVHTIASINEAVLFEIDISEFKDPDSCSPELLGKLLKALLTCARAVQPSVIYIRDVHRLFYRKVPPDEADIDFGILRKFFITKLLKGIQNVDKISVIGTCVNPWDTKHAKLLKQFNNLVMMPDTTYATSFYILQRWVDSNRTIPRDFCVSTLARELRGYSFGTIENILKDFLSGERIVKIAAKGIQAEEIFEFVMNNDALEKVEYEKYDAWYYDKTPWGHKEKKHMHEHKAFQEILAKYAEKAKKKSKSATSSLASSHMSVAR